MITSPLGFINHYTGLANQPTCVLEWAEGRPLGEHNLVMRVTKGLKAEKELLLNYGPLYPCGAPPVRARGKARAKARGIPRGQVIGKTKARKGRKGAAE